MIKTVGKKLDWRPSLKLPTKKQPVKKRRFSLEETDLKEIYCSFAERQSQFFFDEVDGKYCILFYKNILKYF